MNEKMIKTLTTTVKGIGVGLATAVLAELSHQGINYCREKISQRQIYPTVEFSTCCNDYYTVLKYLGERYDLELFRNYYVEGINRDKLRDINLTIGQGAHTLFYKNVKIVVTFECETGAGTMRNDTNYKLKICFKTKNRKIVQDFVHEVHAFHHDRSGRYLYVYQDRGWYQKTLLADRPLTSIAIEPVKMNSILNSIDTFLTNKQWRAERGIPWQLGIILYGPSGTGKTSLIRAIATHYKKDIYYVPPESLSRIGDAMSSIPINSLVVIEDIDSNSAIKTRQPTKSDIPEPKLDELEETLQSFTKISLSSILNAIDGLTSTEGRIIIATTNIINTLDNAMIRPGRFDLKVEVGFVNDEIFKLFVDRFFTGQSYQPFKLKSSVSVSVLQQMVLEDFTLESIIKEITNKEM